VFLENRRSQNSPSSALSLAVRVTGQDFDPQKGADPTESVLVPLRSALNHLFNGGELRPSLLVVRLALPERATVPSSALSSLNVKFPEGAPQGLRCHDCGERHHAQVWTDSATRRWIVVVPACTPTPVTVVSA